MNANNNSSWNSLEVVKIVISLSTPILIFVFGWIVNSHLRSADQLEIRETAAVNISKFIYERRARAEMLASALMRDGKESVRESRDEVIERKKLYDDSYVNWNANYQANLFLIRKILGQSRYSAFEGAVEDHLVKAVFTPLDRCLTKGYDISIRHGNPKKVLDDCQTATHLQDALDCGHAIAGDLFVLAAYTSSSGSQPVDDALGDIATVCP